MEGAEQRGVDPVGCGGEEVGGEGRKEEVGGEGEREAGRPKELGGGDMCGAEPRGGEVILFLRTIYLVFYLYLFINI